MGNAPQQPPDKWGICEFLLDLLGTFGLSAEVAVIANIYLGRFSERSGVPLSPEIWRRATFAAMMLASKAWSRAPFTNDEVAQISPLYSREEVDMFEQAFAMSLGFFLGVRASDFATAHLLLKAQHDGSTASPVALPQLDAEQTDCLERQSLSLAAALRARASGEDKWESITLQHL